MINRIFVVTARASRLLCWMVISVFATAAVAQGEFSEKTLDLFTYPNAQMDQATAQALAEKLRQTYPQALDIHCRSMITLDPVLTVVSHYAISTGRRYRMEGDRFVFPFKTRDGEATDRIEIFSQPQPRMDASLWGTRIQLVVIEFPLMPGDASLLRSADDLKKLAGRLLYDGQLREDVAALRLDELGKDAQVLIIDTQDPFETVYQFFRRRHGRLRLIPARSGDLMTRDFEFDATRTVGLQKLDKVLYIRVQENPVVTDQEGNSKTLLDHTLIQYTFWPAAKSLPEEE